MAFDQNEVTKFPAYISKDIFEKAIQSSENTTNIFITDLKLSMGCSVGENYASDIYRACIKYTVNGIENKYISLIVKAIPYSKTRGPFLDDLEVFDKEIKMYTETLPKLSAILNNEMLCAKCFYYAKDPARMVVFQDLKSLGYVMADRHAGLDENHCNIIMRKLGRLHAASMVLAEKEVHAMDAYSFGMLRLGGAAEEFMRILFEDGLATLINVVKTWPDYDEIVEKLKILNVNFMENIGKYSKYTHSSFKVLNHGDLWVNNTLFKYEHEKPVDVMFVDYQLSFYSSPGIDLNYFISTSPQFEVRAKRRNAIINTYYNSFAKTLRESDGKQQISLEAMLKEISSRELYGFIASVGILPIVLNKDASKESSIDAIADKKASERLRNAMYSEMSYQNAMKYMLSRFDDLKVLDHIF